MAEGQTATNPQTGERVVLRGGQWVPAGGGAPAQPAARQAAPRQDRGTRNRNPGNLKASPWSQRQPGYVGQDSDGFAIFDTPESGDAAQVNLLRTNYAGKSPSQIVNRYAPVGPENSQESVNNYINYASRRVGIDPSQPVPDAVMGDFARAMREFETGQTVALDGAPSPMADMPQAIQEGATATNPQTGERITFTNGQWTTAAPQEVVVDQGVQNVNGRAILAGEDKGPWEDYWRDRRRSQEDRIARVEREATPEYQAAIADARRGSENVPERLRALTQGGALGFLDEIVGGASYIDQALANAGNRVSGRPVEYSASMAAQAARDAERDAQNTYAAANPVENFGLQLAGGLLTPGVGAAGRYVEAGQGIGRLGRAAQVGAGYGAVSGAGYGEGNAFERADDAALGGVIGAGAGAIGQGAIDRFIRPRSEQAGSAARRLSRAGVDLTPGQMASEIPVVGSTIKYAEDILGGYNPLMTGVRQRQNEDVVRVAGNEALSAIGESLPRTARTGREVYNATRTALSQRYDEVTDRVAAVLDDDFDLMMDNLRAQANRNLDGEHASRFNRILDENVLSEVTPEGGLSGDSFKRIETTLRQQSEKARRPSSTLQDDDYAEALDGARDAFRDVIARQFPDEAEAIRGLNLGWATNARIRRAVSGSAGFGRDGTPTPGELSQSVRQLSSEEQIAQDRGLLQGLAQDARTVLPATVGDTGSGQRAVIGGAIGAAGTGVVATVNPVLAGMIATGAVVYSRPGIALLNAAYRATDSRAANVAVQQLARQAKENPALLPYYEAAVQHVAGLARTDTPTAQPAQSSAPVPSAALQRVMQ